MPFFPSLRPSLLSDLLPLSPTNRPTNQPTTTTSGDLFAIAPIAPGTRAQVVEPVADSSRNFVLRLADTATGRHAFVGLGFAERPEAFDFNVALGDHEKHVRRAREIEEAKAKQNASSSSSGAAASGAAAVPSTSSRGDSDPVRSAVSALYGAAGRDLSLKEGETIKVAVVKSGGGAASGGAAAGAAAEEAAPGGGGGFLARQQAATSASSSGGGLFSLPPPPGTAGGGLAPPPPPPPPPAAAAAAVPPYASGNDSGDPFAPLAASNGASSSVPAPSPAADQGQGWATFD